jgi:hypothetical protein
MVVQSTAVTANRLCKQVNIIIVEGAHLQYTRSAAYSEGSRGQRNFYHKKGGFMLKTTSFVKISPPLSSRTLFIQESGIQAYWDENKFSMLTTFTDLLVTAISKSFVSTIC